MPVQYDFKIIPVEGFSTLTMQPLKIVKVEIMPTTMSWIYLSVIIESQESVPTKFKYITNLTMI